MLYSGGENPSNGDITRRQFLASCQTLAVRRRVWSAQRDVRQKLTRKNMRSLGTMDMWYAVMRVNGFGPLAHVEQCGKRFGDLFPILRGSRDRR
jgi:hypothetical protein